MAGVDVGTAYLTIVPSAKGFAGNLQRELGGGMGAAGKKAGSDAAAGFGGSFKSGVSNVAKAGALLLAGVAAGGVAFVKDSIAEARESQKVGAITAQIIKSTGGVAKVTADQVGALSTAISNKTGVDDEAIQAGANMLLTFKNVRNETGKGADVFDRATQAAADLSAAGFGDMAGQSKMLGKALNDPVKGISALSRSGVTFSEQQKEQIKTLVKSGKTLEAQKIILGEVESQVGGVAEKSATAGEKLSTAFGNFKEGIGTSLLPVVDKVAGFLQNRLLPGIQGVIDILFKGDFTKGFREAFKLEEDSKVVDFLFSVRDAARELYAGLTLKDAKSVGAPLEGFIAVGQKVRSIFKELAGGVRAFAAAWAANDGEVTSSGFAGFMETAANAGHKLFDYLKGVLPTIWESAKKLWPPIKEIATQLLAASKAGGVSTFGLLKAAIGALPGILNAVAPLLESLAKWMGENKEIVTALVVALGAGVAAFRVVTTVVRAYTAVQTLLNIVMTANPIGIVVVALAALVAGLIYAYNTSETFRSYVSTAFSVVKIGALSLAKIAVTAFQFLANVFMTVVGTILDGAAAAFGWVPGLGPKLQGAASQFNTFKTEANKSLDAIKNDLQVNIDTEQANIALEALHREFLDKGWTVTAEVRTNMVYVGGGQTVPKARASGGPVSAGGMYAVGDNPDGSWNKTTELFVPRTSGTILTQAQMARSGGAGAAIDYDRLAYAMSQVQVAARISPSALDQALG